MTSNTFPLIPVPVPEPKTARHDYRHPSAALVVICSFFLLCAPTTSVKASVDRLSALGGTSEFIIDDSNSFAFPATALEWPRFEAELFDDWGGAIYPLGSTSALGLFFNRPTLPLGRLNDYLSSHGSDTFRQLEAKPWFDLVYARALSPNLAFGLASSLAYDRRDLGASKTSALATDIRLGIRLGKPGSQTLDLTLGLLTRRLTDDVRDVASLQQTGGEGFSAEVRYRWPLKKGLLLLPFAGLSRETFGLAPQTGKRRSLKLGIGANIRPVADVLVIAGLETRYTVNESRDPGQLPLEDSVWLVPAWVVGGEVQVGSMLFRLALRHENWLTSTQRLRSGQLVEQRNLDSELSTQLGLGLKLGPVLLDGLLERDFLRDGPHFIGGSRHGGGIFSHLGITYRFDRG